MLFSLFAAAAVAAAPQQIANPSWRSRPSGDQMSAVYPAHAAQQRIGGRAMINCVANVNGLLEACQVVSESPTGEGFGAAALLLMSEEAVNRAGVTPLARYVGASAAGASGAAAPLSTIRGGSIRVPNGGRRPSGGRSRQRNLPSGRGDGA